MSEWEELERATPKRKRKQVNRCSFCRKKTDDLTHLTIGGMNIYLCKTCKMIHDMTRDKIDG